MRRILMSVVLALPLLVMASWSLAEAAEPDISAQIAAKKVSVEQTAAQVGNYPLALAEMEKARASLKKAEQAYEAGKQWMGLRGLKPEAEQEVRHHLQMIEMATALATSRATKGRTEEELAAVDKQLVLVKARVKLLEERKAEEERLRQLVRTCEAAAKEGAGRKEESGRLSAQLEQATAEKKKLQERLTVLETEKAALAEQVALLKKQVTVPPAPAPK